MKFKLDQKQIKLEKNVEGQLFELITNLQSFYFISGAGAGKTHALISGVNKFINDNYAQLITNGQKILCITYTNNAANEIKHRLGDNDLVITSTIHSYIWSLVQYHMDLLIDEHVIFLNDIIRNIYAEIYESQPANRTLKRIRSLEKYLVFEIVDKILEDKNSFYESLKSATTFWPYLETITAPDTYNSLNGNYQDLSKYLKKLTRYKELEQCISKIKNNEEGYTSIKYFNTKNIEVLYKNIIGHNILLIYASKLIQKYPFLPKCIIDAHPLVFIDEYQDTDENIINLFLGLDDTAKKESKRFCLGLFGDPMQTIYKEKIHQESEKLEKLVKNINRRSHQNIVSFINIIRGGNQYAEQKPMKIYSKKSYPSLIIETEDKYTSEYLSSIIRKHRDEWGVNKDSRLACLVLKNEMLSQLFGFAPLYRIILDIYQAEHKKGFEMISSEFLFTELQYAGPLPSLLHDLLMPIYLLNKDSDFSISDFYNGSNTQNYSLSDILKSIRVVNSLNCNCLKDLINELFIIYKKESNEVRSLIDINLSKITNGLDKFKEQIIETCRFKNTTEVPDLLDRLFNLDMKQFFLWLDFINQDYSGSLVSYLTCHASKGLEFDNVIIFLSDRFNKNTSYFSSFLNSNIDDTLSSQLESARRLLYVSSSRAIKNLKIYLFTDNEIDKSGIIFLPTTDRR